MNQPSLDSPAPFFAPPGPDQRTMDVDEAADTLIAIITADRNLDQREMRALQRVMSIAQATAEQKLAQQQGTQEPAMSDEPQPFGASEGTEDAAGPQDEGMEPFYG